MPDKYENKDELEHTIRVSNPTLRALNAVKDGNQRHDDIIQEALKEYDPDRKSPADILGEKDD
jgi:predicted metal-dependent hydrolase